MLLKQWPYGIVDEPTRIAWNEYIKTPRDFSRVEPFFLDACKTGSLSARFNYAKFLNVFDCDRAIVQLKRIARYYPAAMFFYAQLMHSREGSISKHRVLALYMASAKKGHMISKVVFPLRKLLYEPWPRKICFLPSTMVNTLVGLLKCALHMDATYEGL